MHASHFAGTGTRKWGLDAPFGPRSHGMDGRILRRQRKSTFVMDVLVSVGNSLVLLTALCL